MAIHPSMDPDPRLAWSSLCFLTAFVSNFALFRLHCLSLSCAHHARPNLRANCTRVLNSAPKDAPSIWSWRLALAH